MWLLWTQSFGDFRFILFTRCGRSILFTGMVTQRLSAHGWIYIQDVLSGRLSLRRNTKQQAWWRWQHAIHHHFEKELCAMCLELLVHSFMYFTRLRLRLLTPAQVRKEQDGLVHQADCSFLPWVWVGGWGVLGGGRSWYEKLPCENACLAILVCFVERFRWQFYFKHFSEDVNSDCKFVHFSWITFMYFSLFVLMRWFLQTSVAHVIPFDFKMSVMFVDRFFQWISWDIYMRMRPLRGSGFVAIHSLPPIATRGECGFSGCNPLVISG